MLYSIKVTAHIVKRAAHNSAAVQALPQRQLTQHDVVTAATVYTAVSHLYLWHSDIVPQQCE
eukprot:8776-Heterococcus_DN1.PRE.2